VDVYIFISIISSGYGVGFTKKVEYFIKRILQSKASLDTAGKKT